MTEVDPLNTLHDMVHRFNRDLIGILIPDRPTLLSPERTKFRIEHLYEELGETRDALVKEGLEETVDGLLDLVYVALGTLVEMGITPGPAFEEVHRANMTRERGEQSRRPGSLGYDAVKPEGWMPPDLAPYLTLTREQVLGIYNAEKVAGLRRSPRPQRMVGPDRGPTIEDVAPEYFQDSSGGPDPSPKPKILVIGHARHGKDTLCEHLRDVYGFRFVSSSRFCAERIMKPYFQEHEGGGSPVYLTVDQCFEDRANHRPVWYEAIRDFNRPDPTALARAILEENDVYCGMRSSAELHACRNVGLFDHVIWADAGQRVEPEPRSSCTVEPWMADRVVDCNGTVEEGLHNLLQLMENLL